MGLIVFWDIDGTLLSIPKISTNRHLRAVAEYTQKNIAPINTEPGQTDLGIIKELFESNKFHYKDKNLNECLNVLNLISLIEIDTTSNVVNPGILEALKYVSQVGGVNTLLTGNSEVRAHHKLKVLELESFFNFKLGHFGGEYLTRSELVLGAKNSLSKSLFSRMILIGDARNDIIAAKSCDLDIIAIATGKHNFLELHELKPNLILENLLVDREVFRNYIRDYL